MTITVLKRFGALARPGLVAATLAMLAVPTAPDAVAKASSVKVDATYRISYGSLKVGSVDMKTRIDGSRYTLDGSFASGGMARLFSKTNGKASGSGQVGQRSLRPDKFALSYKSGKKKRSRSISFHDGRPTDVVLKPNKKRGKNWVEPRVADLEAVLDPLSGIVARGRNGAEVCGRTIRAFDGSMRLDVRMQHSRTKPFRTKGYRGDAHVCSIRLKPVAGYKKGKSDKEIAAIKRAEAVFVPVNGSDIHQLVELTVPTSIGEVSARATKLRIK